ncbi:hypothetical protein ACWDV4_10385 [Micromonospora sp. NPDC003197]
MIRRRSSLDYRGRHRREDRVANNSDRNPAWNAPTVLIGPALTYAQQRRIPNAGSRR